MHKKYLAVIYIFIAFFMALFVWHYETSTRSVLTKRIENKVKYNLITPFWNLNIKELNSQLKHLLISEDASAISIYHKDGRTCISVKNQKLDASWLNKFLFTTGFYMESSITVPLIMKDETAGRLEYRWLNRNNSVYAYIGILLLLLGIITAGNFSLRDKHKSLAKQIEATEITKELLTKSESFLSNIFESMSDGIAVIDKKFTIIKVNAVQQRRFNESGFLTGKKCYEVFHLRNMPCSNCPTREAFTSGKPAVKVDIEKDNSGNIVKAVEISCYPLKDPNSHDVTRVIERTRDITRERILEMQLRSTEKMSAIGQLAGGVAHDFNNQLTVIIGYANLLKTCLDDKYLIEESAEKILNSAKRASDLCRQLLEFSRQGTLKEEAVNIHHIIVEVVSLLQRSLAKNIKLEEHLNAGTPLVTGDPSALQNALLNLGINACDAMKNDGMIKFTTFDVEIKENHPLASRFKISAGNYIQIDITDNGEGIDEKNIERIFEPFFTTKQKDKGTGMGLASVYGTVCNHKGAVTCRSRKGEGTTFTVILPHAEHYRETDFFKEKNIIAGAGNHVLLIDDEIEVAEITSIMLKKIGYKCTIINNPIEAIGYFRKNRFNIDLVILDMLMPDLNGREVFEKLKEIKNDVRVIILSGYNENIDTRCMLSNGAIEYLLKPFEITTLSEAINKAIHGYGKRN
ncbi:MAG: hybrid sensor histidine kinase/response regulator [Planctomycetota bacterium]